MDLFQRSLEQHMAHPYGMKAAVTADAVQVTVSPGLGQWILRDQAGAILADIHGELIEGFMGEGLHYRDGEIVADFSPASPEEFERRIVDHLHGNLAIFTRGSLLGRRLYADYGTSLSPVFAPGLAMVASSACFIFEGADYDRHLLGERVGRIVSAEGQGAWISGSLTAHEGLFRLLPNHYLDLDTFQQHRFWPRQHDFSFGMKLEDAAASCAQDMRAYVEACVAQFDVSMGMTAGFDTRIIMAAARQVKDRVQAYTFKMPGIDSDSIIAEEICARFGIRHQKLDTVQSTDAQKLWWDRCVGHSVREVNRDIFPSLLLAPGNMGLSGTHGEAGRSRFYRDDFTTINRHTLTPVEIMDRVPLRRHPEILAEVEAWLKPIAWLPSSVILDLALIELKGVGWSSAQGPAQKAMKSVMKPFCQRRVQNAMMAVDPLEKGTTALFQRIGEINWPEAMTIPVNRFGDYRDYLVKLQKYTNPHKIRNFIRKKLG